MAQPTSAHAPAMGNETLQELRVRFGRLVAAHRRRHGWTQEELAARAELSVDMVSRIEAGATGARFNTIDKLATAMKVDPAEFFSPDIPNTVLSRPRLTAVVARIARLSDDDLGWLEEVLKVVLKHR